MTPDFELPTFSKLNQSIDYQEHRTLLKELGLILSGMKPTHEEEHFIYFYRTPTYTTAASYPQLIRLMGIDLEYDGTAFTANGKEVIALNALEAQEFLTSLLHLVATRRREFALAANARMALSDRAYPSPSGAEGHLLKEYDLLLDQIKHEYHHRRREGANNYGDL